MRSAILVLAMTVACIFADPAKTTPQHIFNSGPPDLLITATDAAFNGRYEYQDPASSTNPNAYGPTYLCHATGKTLERIAEFENNVTSPAIGYRITGNPAICVKTDAMAGDGAAFTSLGEWVQCTTVTSTIPDPADDTATITIVGNVFTTNSVRLNIEQAQLWARTTGGFERETCDSFNCAAHGAVPRVRIFDQPTFCPAVPKNSNGGHVLDANGKPILTGCTVDHCCTLTCASHTCETPGWILRPSAQSVVCSHKEGCTDGRCCAQTCASAQTAPDCIGQGYAAGLRSNADKLICHRSGCTAGHCCAAQTCLVKALSVDLNTFCGSYQIPKSDLTPRCANATNCNETDCCVNPKCSSAVTCSTDQHVDTSLTCDDQGPGGVTGCTPAVCCVSNAKCSDTAVTCGDHFHADTSKYCGGATCSSSDVTKCCVSANPSCSTVTCPPGKHQSTNTCLKNECDLSVAGETANCCPDNDNCPSNLKCPTGFHSETQNLCSTLTCANAATTPSQLDVSACCVANPRCSGWSQAQCDEDDMLLNNNLDHVVCATASCTNNDCCWAQPQPVN